MVIFLTKTTLFDTLVLKNTVIYVIPRRIQMKKFVLAVLFVLVTALPALAKTTLDVNPLTQEDFKSFSRDLGMVLSYVPMAPAAPLGNKLPGFDAGVEASYVKLDKGALWYQKMDNFMRGLNIGELPNAVVIPRVHVQVG